MHDGYHPPIVLADGRTYKEAVPNDPIGPIRSSRVQPSGYVLLTLLDVQIFEWTESSVGQDSRIMNQYSYAQVTNSNPL